MEYKDIAAAIGSTIGTVRNQAKIMYLRLRIHSRDQLELDDDGELRVIRPDKV